MSTRLVVYEIIAHLFILGSDLPYSFPLEIHHDIQG